MQTAPGSAAARRGAGGHGFAPSERVRSDDAPGAPNERIRADGAPDDIATGSELTGLRTEMHAGFAELRTEMHAGFAELRSEMHAGFAELRSEMHAAHSELLLKLFFGMVASNATLVGLVLAAVRLG